MGGKSFQTKQGNRPTGHDQEGRRGLNEVVPGTSVFPLSETGVLGAGQVAWYSHLFQNFPQFIVIHTVKGFGIVNKAKIDVFSGTLLPFR